MIKPLYEIANNYLALLNEISEADELTDELLTKLDEAKGDINEKIINVSAYIRNLEYESDNIDDAIRNMLERSKKRRAKAQSIKDYLKNILVKFNINEIKSPYFDIKIKNNPCSVSIVNYDDLPERFIKNVSLVSVDKKAIAKEIKNGNVIPGAKLIQSNRVEIK